MVQKSLVSGFYFLKKFVPIIKNQAVNLKTNSVKVAQRAFRILVVLLLIFPLRIFSQQQIPLGGKNTSHTLRISKEFQQKLVEESFGFQLSSVVIAPGKFFIPGDKNYFETHPI